MLISPEYLALQRQLHETYQSYGTSGAKYADIVRQVSKWGRLSILDYGCGRCTLAKALGPAYRVTNYDPCIPGLDKSPEPHDIVACIDVLEHIEPKCLEDVLGDLRRVIKKAGFFLMANRPAQKVLADGRNAHLIQKGPEWWLPLIMSRWHLSLFHEVEHDGHPIGFVVVVRAP